MSFLTRMPRHRFRWLLVAGAFLSQFFSQGANWAYGIYARAYCQSDALGTDGQQRLCALPGSLAVASWSLFGLVVGRIADDPRVGFRAVALFGSAVWTAAYLIASFSQWYALTVISQGLMAGLAASCTYFPTIAMVSKHFGPRRDGRGLALGITISGTGFGGFAQAAAAQAMITYLGIPWALRITGLVGGAVLAAVALLLVPVDRWPPETAADGADQLAGKPKGAEVEKAEPEMASGDLDRKEPAEVSTSSTVSDEPTVVEDANGAATVGEPAHGPDDGSAPRTPGIAAAPAPLSAPKPRRSIRSIVTTAPFLLSSAVVFFMPWGSMSPAYWGASYSVDVLGMDPSAAAFQVSIFNIASTVGRVVQGAVAEYVGGPATNLFFSILLSGTLIMAAWPNVHSAAGMSAYMAFQGLAGGSYNGILPQVVSLNFEPDVLATAMSMIYSFFAYGSLAGPVIQGLLLDLNTSYGPDGTKQVWYLPMQMYAGSVLLVSAVFAAGLRMYMSRGRVFVQI
ncbi:major facilitator superfamily domain-containing protein [Hyaloraphidium curvatum]|nr:major facilitator superfamily domain-containing protein [Hyaloraphidium curvatum]